ncbi:TrkA family potassium uptake protein [Anaerotignum propionicum]|uniref:potassium channel family protein n=1 Tax=Anaerotignum propionicum TaxID=28446 RepID=UPI000E90FF4C|nr:TrkA family potassium uptake protein [Anaerotignum propionicum]MEA4841922.1 TrkA family potassium uptake protein [[Clostridium] symbiosum]HBF66761.1 potassium transporter TrkA [Clostridium sp.]
MKRFTNKQEYQNYIIIIGCGRLGANLANTLSEGNGNVLIIDKNKDAFRKLSPSYGGLSIIGDATDIDVMLEAQMNNASAVIAVTNNDNANIMVAQIAREMFHIKRVIARLYDPDREYVYNEFGIDTICPAVLSAKEIDKILSQNILTKNVIKEEEQ